MFERIRQWLEGVMAPKNDLEDLIGIGFLLTWQQLDRIERKLDNIIQQEAEQVADLTQIQNDVAANGDVVQSAVTLLQGLKAQLDEAIASNDPAALAELSAALEQQTQSLADAVTANTPAAPAPSPTPEEPPA